MKKPETRTPAQIIADTGVRYEDAVNLVRHLDRHGFSIISRNPHRDSTPGRVTVPQKGFRA